MNNEIAEYLEIIDLTGQESLLYLLLIESGPLSIKDLAAKASIKRPTAYIYLDQLIDKGLVMKIVKGTNKLVAAIDPEISLQKLIKDKMQNALDMKKKLPSIINRIHEILPKQTEISKAEIKFYKGKNGVKKIYEEALKTDILRSYVTFEENTALFPINIGLLNQAFINNPKIIIYEICEEKITARKRSKMGKNVNHYWKFLPKGAKLSANNILMYDEKVAIINLKNKETVEGIIIQNKDYYEHSIQIYDVLWKLL